MFCLSQELLSKCYRDLGLGCYEATLSPLGIFHTLQFIISHFCILLFLSFWCYRSFLFAPYPEEKGGVPSSLPVLVAGILRGHLRAERYYCFHHAMVARAAREWPDSVGKEGWIAHIYWPGQLMGTRPRKWKLKRMEAAFLKIKTAGQCSLSNMSAGLE